MKKICTVALIFAFMQIGVLADAPAVSSNTFGIIRVESSTTNTLIAVPWTWYSEQEADAMDILAKKLVKTNNLEVNDLLYSYLTNGTYRAWMVRKDAVTNELYWEPCATATVGADGTGTILVDGDTDQSEVPTTWEPYLAAIADDDAVTKVARGNAVWLRRQHPTNPDGSPKPFWVYGQSVSTPVSNTVAAPSGTAKYATTLLGNPYAQAVRINDLQFSGKPDASDLIFVPDGTLTPKTLIYSKNKWRHAYPTTKNGVTVNAYDDNVTVPAGLAFWYDRRGKTPLTITWTDPSETTTP